MKNFLSLAVIIAVISCTEVKNSFELPVLGRKKVIEKEENGQIVYDTVTHKIGSFAFVNQDSAIITDEKMAGQVYVADFFFTSCPTICPTMKQQMLRVYKAHRGKPDFAILSHTIDPEYDTVALLADYAERLDVSSDTWHFVTGDKDEIYDIAEKSYLSVADEDEGAPGGYVHSGAFILVDKDQQIRGVYDGTMPEQVDILIKDVDQLLKSYDQNKS